MKQVEFSIASFREFKASYKKEVIQSNIGKTKCEIDAILEEMYITYINKELNVNVSTLKEAKYKRVLAHLKEYYAVNKEEIDANNKEYYAANRDRIVARLKENRATNKEKTDARKKEYYAANKERIVAYNKEYYAANKEKINRRRRERYLKAKGGDER